MSFSMLSRATTKAPPQPFRMYFYAPEKWGKTSFAASAPKPIFLMTQGETGLLDLIDFGQIQPTAHLPPSSENANGFGSWTELVQAVDELAREPHGYETLVIDTANGAERMLARYVLEEDFAGRMTGKNSFSDYGKGNIMAAGYWAKFLQQLDEVRSRRRMNVVLLAHSQIKNVNNPEGADYDQLRPEGINQLWPLTHKWASVIACGSFQMAIDDKTGKATGGRDRVMRTRATASVVAGNRYGLPEFIPCGNDPLKAYGHFATAMSAARAKGPAPDLTKDQFAELMRAKGWTWSGVLDSIDRTQGTTLTKEKAGFSDVAPNVLLDFAAWMREQPDKAPPASPPPAAMSGQRPAAQPHTVDADAQPGDDSPDTADAA